MLGFVALNLLFKTEYVGSLARISDFAQVAIQHRRLRLQLKQEVIRVFVFAKLKSLELKTTANTNLNKIQRMANSILIT